MDRASYVAMNGAKAIMQAQSANANNIANANTVGFRADLAAFKDVPINGYGLRSRVNVTRAGRGWNRAAGPLEHTGRALDVAVKGSGWLAVQTANGGEAYTRAGHLKVSANGLLTTDNGRPVLGNGGPVALPPHSKVTVGNDGTISVVPLGEPASEVAVVDRLKLVNPGDNRLSKGHDGLMHLPNGNTADTDADVHVASGFLEQSNVTPAAALVRMVQLARQFEMQVKEIKAADRNGRASQQLLRMN